MSHFLEGLQVLTTRPEQQATRLVAPLQKAGIEVTNIPLLAIQPLTLTPQERQGLLDLDHFQKVVVISPSAAQLLLEKLDDYWPQWPVGVDWFTVGAGTASLLEQAGLSVQFPASGDKSEDLLQLPALQELSGEKLLLVKGQGGRPLLEATLVSRGAQVRVLELYTRVRPRLNQQQLQALNSDVYQAVVITSGEALQQYIEFTEEVDKKRPLLLPSYRLEKQARELGFTRAINTGGAGADAILAGLKSLDPGCHPS
ncbi:uroporphyrinogen-III synthase [Marinospirillum celere]|uniref:Uroporphyrinogen-III synthase n=1 Tax=Marinospirillum celere TaxID=1122252 RepID=A0A1I1I6H6_9GAMM|nr:uroporphyrinogen-III synthase [Marinospirillum celere]SFC31635.1 uroporphyrinogen-III synthase [Marinospirillum celere]